MRTSIYLPDQLAEQIKQHNISISEVSQAALRQAVQQSEAKEALMTDMAAVIERLRGTLNDEDRDKRQAGHEDGVTWAKQEATAAELEHMATSDRPRTVLNGDHTLVAFCSARDGENYIEVTVDAEDPYWEGFIAGAAEVWDFVGERLHWKGNVMASRDW